jgi:hypothetical protein
MARTLIDHVVRSGDEKRYGRRILGINAARLMHEMTQVEKAGFRDR